MPVGFGGRTSSFLGIMVFENFMGVETFVPIINKHSMENLLRGQQVEGPEILQPGS